MQKKSLETILYSSAGIVGMLVILIAVNVITGVKPVRLDLTREKAYTLSAGTKAILRKLDTPVKIRFYCTQSEAATPETVYLKDYAHKVEDLLREYQQVAGKNLIIEKYDPQPDSDAEDSARLDGLEPQALQGEDQFYLGLAVSLADERVAIPFLDPNRERQLEYDLTRVIARVFTPEKPVIGIMSALPVFGEMSNPMMMQMGQQGAPAWTIIEQLKQDFTVRRVEMTADKIDDDVKVLVVIHPKDISDSAQYAIDQFVLRGGKLIAFLDAQSALASRQQNPMSGGEAGGTSSSLDKLLKAWGIQFDTGKVVADLNFKMQLRGPNGQPMEAPTWLGLTSEGINRDDIVTSQIDTLWLPMCGAFTGEPAAGLKETVLLQSSPESQLVDGLMASMGGESVLSGFKASGVNYKLAIRLTGKFKTAFPDGNPADKAEAGNTNRVAKTNNSLKESKLETSVVLFGDSDLLADEFLAAQGGKPVWRDGHPDECEPGSGAKPRGTDGRGQQSHRRAQPGHHEPAVHGREKNGGGGGGARPGQDCGIAAKFAGGPAAPGRTPAAEKGQGPAPDPFRRAACRGGKLPQEAGGGQQGIETGAEGFAQGSRVAGDAAQVAQHSGHAAGRGGGGPRHRPDQT
jgi:ABC-type uncharacterized transport system involved in gliding motility auxiliary subunit